jgi:L-Lysine epsilon oxidase N-terminal/L-lysine epsilon oxidase C-terminal domain
MAASIYRIHPAIGIARVGNADRSSFFIGPELAGLGPTGDAKVGTRVPPFKGSGKIKPQAARFRIWEYVEKNNLWEPQREVNLGEKDCVSIEWTAHVANRKASFFEFAYQAGEESRQSARRNAKITNPRKLELDPLPRSISGANRAGVEFRKGTSKNPARELWPDPPPSPPIEYLGELRTDDAGRLIFIGGLGLASGRPGGVLAPGGDTFNSVGWFDDVSDGPVTAVLTLKGPKGNQVVPVEPAWVICGPPDYAPSLANQVTLYDVLYDMAARQLDPPVGEGIFASTLSGLFDINLEFQAAKATKKSVKLKNYKPSFDDEIYPILRRGQGATFVFEQKKQFHGLLTLYSNLGDPGSGSQGVRQLVFDRIHVPNTPGNNGRSNMPLMHGDAYAQPRHKHFMCTVTETQYALLERWVSGNFIKTKGAFPPARPSWMTSISPHGLDRAALENCVGGALGPGIEVSWQIRHPKLYTDPFRLNPKATTQYLGDRGAMRAGHFTRQMSLPWQTDFLSCALTNGLGWWPQQRPDIAYMSKADYDANPRKPQYWARPTSKWPGGGGGPTYKEFVDHWYKLGFVYEGPATYHLENERDTNVP